MSTVPHPPDDAPRRAARRTVWRSGRGRWRRLLVLERVRAALLGPASGERVLPAARAAHAVWQVCGITPMRPAAVRPEPREMRRRQPPQRSTGEPDREGSGAGELA